MTAQENEARLAELARLGNHMYYTVVQPQLRPEDDDKFVAVDVDTGAYEVDPSDNLAIDRLLFRRPTARVWLMRAGHTAAYRIRRFPEVG